MRRAASRFVAVVVCATVLVAGGVGSGAAHATVRRAPSNSFCSAFSDYYTASFVIQFAVGLVKSFGGEAKAKLVRNEFVLILSPKLEHVTREMAGSAPKLLRPVFKQQADVFAAGVALLREVGLTDKQIKALAAASLDTNSSDLEKLTGKTHLSKKALERAAKKFAPQVDKVDLSKISRRQRAALGSLGSACGVLPDSTIDCTTLVTSDEASTALGTTATRDAEKPCTYDGPPKANGDPSAILTLETYGSARAFKNLTKSVKNQDVPGVGDAAVALDSFSSFSHAATCGKTLIVRDSDRTIVVALCRPDDAEVPIDTLTGLAQNVLERLPTG